jgi:hypothetical protein
MRFHRILWGFMRFYDVSVNRSVPTEANRGLTYYRRQQGKLDEELSELLEVRLLLASVGTLWFTGTSQNLMKPHGIP